MPVGPDWKHMGGRQFRPSVARSSDFSRENRNLEFYVKNSQFLRLVNVYHVKTKQNVSLGLTGPWPSVCNATCVSKSHITSHTGILWSDVASLHLCVFVPFELWLENESPADQSRVGCQGSQGTAPKGHAPESSCLRSMSCPYQVLRGQI